jgi:serpin B
MIHQVARSLCAGFLTAAWLSGPTEAKAANADTSLVAGNTAFSWALYARLKPGDGNLFFSPYSISTCLALAYSGARGDTAAQMARTLHWDPDQNQLAASFGELQGQINNPRDKRGIELDLANGLWAQQDHPFLPAFLEVARRRFGAKVEQVDFRVGGEAVRKEINDWVSHQTKGKITGLIQPGALDPATRLVLANAIYFKGRWAREFNKRNTTQASFSVTPSRKIEAPLMHLTADFKYAEVEGVQLLELPYAGDDLVMVVLLPRESDGLTSLEGRLNEQTLGRWRAQSREQKVEVFFPKFKLTTQFNLAQPLVEMGLSDAFSRRADFSGMDGERDLLISTVVHKAFVEVNEEGTEAAAATGTIMRSMAIVQRPPIPTFRADHPFLFLIHDRHSGAILFLGRVADPTQP